MDLFVFFSFLVAQMVKKLPTMQENPVQPLGQKIPCKRSPGIPTPVLSWGIPWTVEPGGLQSMKSKKSDTTEQLRHIHRGSMCLFYFTESLRIFFSKLVFYNYFSHMLMQGDLIWTVKNVSVILYKLHTGTSAVILSTSLLYLPCNNLLCQWVNSMAQKLHSN